jgi:hypothetical protein
LQSFIWKSEDNTFLDENVGVWNVSTFFHAFVWVFVNGNLIIVVVAWVDISQRSFKPSLSGPLFWTTLVQGDDKKWHMVELCESVLIWTQRHNLVMLRKTGCLGVLLQWDLSTSQSCYQVFPPGYRS